VVLSRYKDDVWELGAEIYQGHMTSREMELHWDVDLLDGTNLFDPQHAKLLESAKRLFHSMLFNQVDGKKKPKARTVVHKFNTGLVSLLRWMGTKKYRSFNEIADLGDYVAFARTQGGRHKHHPAKSTVRQRLEIVVDIWDHRVHLDDCVNSRPWPKSSPEKKAGIEQADRMRPKTREIPEVALISILHAASKYVVERADAIMAARVAVEKARTNALVRGVGTVYATQLASKVARKLGFRDLYELTREETRLRTACYIVILGLSGMRKSEVLSLVVACIFLSTLPGGTRVIRLRGTLYKGIDAPKGRLADWVVPPLVAAAVHVLERLTAQLRDILHTEEKALFSRLEDRCVDEKERRKILKRLFVVTTQKDKVFLTGLTGFHEVEVPCASTMDRSLKEFAMLHEVCDDQGRPWDFSAHQFRRTFACVVVRLRGGDLLCLQDQLKHWTLDRTIYYADGALDRTLLDEMFGSEGKLEIRGSVVRQKDDASAPKRQFPIIVADSKVELLARLDPESFLRASWHGWCVAGPGGRRDHRCPVNVLFGVKEWGSSEAREFLPVLKVIEAQQKELIDASGWREPGLARAKEFLRVVREVVGRAEAALGGGIR
jgi:integrase